MITLEERQSLGSGARTRTPRSSHTGWVPAAGRRNPVDLLEGQNTSREQDLVPVRHGRMMVSPFTFYRGAARVMAEDLKDTPTAGLIVQLCGDAHLSNFGVFGSPERRLVFDLNDFDETLPGPFEWDVKRMAASFVVAARDNAFTPQEGRAAALASATAYREAMAEFARQGTMDIWYASLDEDKIKAAVLDATKTATKSMGTKSKADGERARMARLAQKRVELAAAKAHTRDSLQALSKLGEPYDGRYRIVNQPPI